MNGMTRAQARRFRDRWRAVGLIEAMEHRVSSAGLRWQQLNALWRMAIGLGLPLTEAEGAQEVRERWIRLKARDR
ncbi:MAG: hypothetical protein J7452_05585 [Thermoflexus sp.]|jgi:hypothetical protein|nr:hypothetical protein [Thermoflexus sp.]